MTEKINKSNALTSAVFLLLTLIASGVGWLIVQNNIRINTNEERIMSNEKYIIELQNISRNLIETYNLKAHKDDAQDKEILELWKCTKRGSRPEPILKQ